MVFGLFRRRTNEPDVTALHASVVAAARRAFLFDEIGIADTVEGRVEALFVFAFLATRRLARGGEEAAAAGAFVDRLFADLDRGLRELGTADLKVPRKMTALAAGWRGRSEAYGKALDADDPLALAGAFDRNVLGRSAAEPSPEARRLAALAIATDASLAAHSAASILSGAIAWPEPRQGEPA